MAGWIVLACCLGMLGFSMFLSYRERLRPLRQAIREDVPEVLKGFGALGVLVLIQVVALAPTFVVAIRFGEGWGALTWLATLFIGGGLVTVVQRLRRRRAA